MLWLDPAREWFATGRWTPPSPAPEKEPRRTPLGGQGGQSGQSGQGLQPPSGPSRRCRRRPPGRSASDRPPAGHAAAEHRPTSSYAAPDAGRHQQLLHARPGAMVAAFVITVVMAGGLLALSLLWIAIAGLSPELLRAVLEQQQPGMFDDGLTFQQVRETVFAYRRRLRRVVPRRARPRRIRDGAARLGPPRPDDHRRLQCGWLPRLRGQHWHWS